MNEELKNRIIFLNNVILRDRTIRMLTTQDIELFEHTFAEHKNDMNIRSIRVYPDHAFVPRSYKCIAKIPTIWAVRDNEGNWQISARLVDAHHPNGRGPRVTINGRSK